MNVRVSLPRYRQHPGPVFAMPILGRKALTSNSFWSLVYKPPPMFQSQSSRKAQVPAFGHRTPHSSSQRKTPFRPLSIENRWRPTSADVTTPPCVIPYPLYLPSFASKIVLGSCTSTECQAPKGICTPYFPSRGHSLTRYRSKTFTSRIRFLSICIISYHWF